MNFKRKNSRVIGELRRKKEKEKEKKFILI